MRPLAVLILILGASAALVFALVSMLGGDRGDQGTLGVKDLIVGPAEPATSTPSADLAEPAPVAPAAGLDRKPAESRTGSGGGGAFEGFIVGTVVTEDGDAVSGATVSLLSTPGRPGQYSEVIRLMNNSEPPKARARAKTGADGGFRFESLPPGDDWQLVVTHDEYVRAEAGPISITETGGHEELVVLEEGLAFFGAVKNQITGTGIEGAVVVIDSPLASFLPQERASLTRLEAVTDFMGNYGFRNVPGGQRTLTVMAPGYATQVHHNLSALIAAERKPGPMIVRMKLGQQKPERDKVKMEPVEKDFELAPGMSIAGTVLGPDRIGVEGVVVSALQTSGQVGSRGVALSRNGGEFLIEGLASGQYMINAEIEGFDARPVQRVEAGRTDVEILLAELGSVAGRVVDDETGRPVSSFTARVRTMNERNVSWGGVVAKKRFNNASDGNYTLTGVTEGEYVVEAFARGYASSFSEPFSVTQGVTTPNIVVRLGKGGTITGRVIDRATGEAVANAEVRTEENNHVDSELINLIDSMGSSAITKRKVYTNDAGYFEIDLMTPDEYQVQVRKNNYTAHIQNNVKVGARVKTDIGIISLSSGASITGIVYGRDGEPAAGASVMMNPISNDIWNSLEARCDANGRFLLRNALPGDYKLSASNPVRATGNPFEPIADLRNSEIEITVVEGMEYEYDLYMGSRN